MNVGAYLNRVSIGTNLTTTTETTCYTAGVPFAQMASIRATNVDTTARALTLKWHDASVTGTFHLLKASSVQVGAHMEMLFPDGMVLRDGDTITAEASAVNAFDVIVTVIEAPSRSQ